jgi:hypothetical protein
MPTLILTASSCPAADDTLGLSLPALPLLPRLLSLSRDAVSPGGKGSPVLRPLVLPPQSLLLMSLGVLLQLYACWPAVAHTSTYADAAAHCSALTAVLSSACVVCVANTVLPNPASTTVVLYEVPVVKLAEEYACLHTFQHIICLAGPALVV